MNNFEEIIKTISKNDIDIPIKVQKGIDYALKNKARNYNWRHYLRKVIIAILSILTTLIGSASVYAIAGGKIEGVPAMDWFGTKFSSKYVEYKQAVENQVIAFENTSVELTSTLCNEGITILEFNIKLSEEDYKKLEIGESVITELC